ncbi:MAG: alpha/beta fold hydrolase [Anaerolineae bacterium]|nr:alpha/beta fold hydrolase [Anaerolineae bacterium]
MMRISTGIYISLLAILLSGCVTATPTQPTSPAADLPAPGVRIITPTAAPSLAPAPTSLPSSTPQRDSLFPYTIAGLRERDYPAGEIRVGAPLDVTAAFTRYPIAYASDGLTITGILQIPPGDGPFPVILLNHGYYNRAAYRSGDGTDLIAEILNQHGYLTVSSDYRGWGGSDSGPSLFHAGLVVDVMHLFAAIDSLPQADSQRVGMLGHSMGGGITTKILTLPTNLRAAVLYAPNSADDADLVARWGYGCIGDINLAQCNSADTLPAELPAELLDSYRQAALDPLRMREIAPIYHLAGIEIPVQIHIGEADGNYIGSTPPEWSYKLYDALVSANAPAELFRYPAQRHSFTGPGASCFWSGLWLFLMNTSKSPDECA